MADLFSIKPSATSSLSSITAGATTTVTRNNVKLVLKDYTIFAQWLGNEDDTPFYFCNEYKRDCAQMVDVFTSTTKIKTVDFFPGRNDVIMIARKNGIYAVEADKRKVQNFALVYAGGDPDFRIGRNGVIYVRDGDNYYSLTLSI